MTDVLTVDQRQGQVDRQENDYAELRHLIRERGLLDKQLAYYTYKILSTLGTAGPQPLQSSHS